MTATDNGVSDSAAVQAAESHGRGLAQRLVLENGIVLRLKPVPPLAMRSAASRVKRPEVPIVMIEEKGREEPNPSDPGYLAALGQWEVDQREATLTVALVIGTEVESIPEGMYGPDDDGWIDALREAHALIDIGDPPVIHDVPGSKARYLDWMRWYALPTEMDIFKITRMLTLGVSLSEAEVQGAADSFRNLLTRFTTAAEPAPAEPDLGDRGTEHGGGADPGV